MKVSEKEGGLSFKSTKNVRQMKAAKLYVESVTTGAGMTKKEILAKAGYSREVQEVPHKVFEKESFKELLDRMMPDSLLVENHLDLINNSDDQRVRLGAVKLGYQVKGNLQEVAGPGGTVTNIAVFGLPSRSNKVIDVDKVE